MCINCKGLHSLRLQIHFLKVDGNNTQITQSSIFFFFKTDKLILLIVFLSPPKNLVLLLNEHNINKDSIKNLI